MTTDSTPASQLSEGTAAPPPRHGIVSIILPTLLVGITIGATGTHLLMHGCARNSKTGLSEARARKAPLYQCPMHPTVTSDHPGDCPICGMSLVPLASVRGPGGEPGERKVAFYRSPTGPSQTSETPKGELSTAYVPVYEDEVQGAGAPPVKGLTTVSIDPARQQLIGLRTEKVTKGPVGTAWHTVARIEVDPTRVRKTNVKIEGFVEKIFVDFVGQSVRKGQPLFSVYSPTLFSAQSEYLLALQTRDALAKSGGSSENGDNLITAARRRLELWDITAAEINRIARVREPTKTLTFVSPISGVVTAKNVVQGARVSPGEAPYEITDLGMVWVMADAYQNDIGRIRVGMKATLTLAAYPGRSFPGQVVFIDPLLDPKTRTAKVHLHFANPDRELKPEMFGEVTLQTPTQEGLRIPADAVIRAGTQDVVFVAQGAGRFEPRLIQLGAKNGDEVEVTSGLALGQAVVTRANFLVDSESQLRAALATVQSR